ncbi:4-hydroxyphenylacetate catabolism regulatory protein HpaA [Haliea sp. AH-315-K21]|uniref:4-hydroxyphenylacetate catabolism regulatory protein HpaA n=1 Tax=SAR86 cluster bacterium TaxID=2030880 RepID=A0A2A5C8Y9_9GAMM|nr:4-hydroxyphenylacetate catabolism regulatory protein HpaA [Haliea sp. AH-315-K21]PCJ40339.1 MAG: 4-hydroxyphenylacetate catabolism regulatory protein HpaA [SAR86 cluster bacterium]
MTQHHPKKQIKSDNKQLPSSDWIPNINLGEDYDRRYIDASIHYDAQENLAVFFGRDMPVHRHAQYLQIHYFERGDINFHIDDKLFQVEGPCLFLTPPAIPHSFQTMQDAGGHVLTIHQSLIWELMKRGLQNVPEIDLQLGICLTEKNMHEEQRNQWQLIQQLLQNIKNEWLAESPAKFLVLENFVYLLIIQIARLSSRQVKSSLINNDDLRLFHRFSNEIETHLHEHWHLYEYTRTIGVSASRLYQICKRISNSSPKKIIRERLLQEVKRMLTFSSLSSNEISYKLGFNDPAYFSRFFKAQTGMTPHSYRKKQALH